MKPADARSELVHALRLDAIGPDPDVTGDRSGRLVTAERLRRVLGAR